MTAHIICARLDELADADIAAHSRRFFKSGIGEYGYGDRFLGIRVPVLRKLVSEFHDTGFGDMEILLRSKYHEVRLFVLLLMVHRFTHGSEEERERIFHLYRRHTAFVNNWDLVDSSAPHIVGPWLLNRERSLLYTFAHSAMLWERRIAILSTAYFIKNNQYDDTLNLAAVLLNDPEDLIHKAVGWMLREVGKRDLPVEERFLQHHYSKMPRTMLRYAIERFDEERRQLYLKGEL